MSIIADYFPKPEELRQEDRVIYREKLYQIWKRNHPDIDARPGTVVGDHIVAGAADFLLMLEIATQRFFSDICLENPANGIIYNCDIVREYIRNFGLTDVTPQPARGFIRLTFNNSETRSLPRNLGFAFGDTRIFYPHLSGSQPAATLQAVGLPITQPDTYCYVNSGSGFEVVIPVVGSSDFSIQQGTLAQTSDEIDGLISARAAEDMTTGTESISLPKLAEMARKHYSMNSQIPAGLRSHLLRRFPDIKVAHVVRNTDEEAVRPPVSSTTLEMENPDILVRGFRPRVRRTFSLFGIYDYGTQTFLIQLPPTICTRIVSVRHIRTGRTFTENGSGEGFRTISTFNSFSAPNHYMMTEAEQISMVVNPGSMPLPPEVAPPNIGATFEVVVDEDPTAIAVTRMFDVPANRPFYGERLQVRPLFPTYLSEVRVRYRKQASILVSKQNLERELIEKLESFGGDDFFTIGPLIDICSFNGVSGVMDIRFSGTHYWSASMRFSTGARPSTATQFNTLWSSAFPLPRETLSLTTDPRLDISHTVGPLLLRTTKKSQGLIADTAVFVFEEVI